LLTPGRYLRIAPPPTPAKTGFVFRHHFFVADHSMIEADGRGDQFGAPAAVRIGSCFFAVEGCFPNSITKTGHVKFSFLGQAKTSPLNKY
jgi:hypothetical protein